MAAGESSGDRLGGALAAELLRRRPELRIAGIGKDAMKNAGVEIFAPCGALSVMGYWDAAAGLPAILSLRRRLLAEIRRRRPRLFIGIDAPDFNLTVAPKARGWGVKTVQYTSPSVWMWRRGRIAKISRAVDEVWCLFPFEPEVYSGASVAARFVGHPAAEAVYEKAAARRGLQIAAGEQLIALMPGSRDSELRMHLPLFAETVRLLKKSGRRFAAVAVDERAAGKIRAALPGIEIHLGAAEEILAAADAALVKCGTSALQAALAQTPMAVVYKISPVARAAGAWRKFSLPFFSLPNILSGRFIVPEFLQAEARAPDIAKYMARILEDETARAAQISALAAVGKNCIPAARRRRRRWRCYE